MSSLEHVKWIKLPSNSDNRGVLTSIESNIDTPFSIKRIFYMHHIISDRGGHAHTETDQIIIAISGSFKIDLFDGIGKQTFKVNNPTKGLYIPRMIFLKMSHFSKNAVCLVLASTHYDITKSIRKWEDYISFTQNNEV